MQLKKLRDQTIVLTGATSGIGLTTARMAAREGAQLVLAARDTDALRQLCDELGNIPESRPCIAVTADVGRLEDVERIAAEAVERFGGFDTWINNAGVSIYGRLLDIKPEDHQRLFETNFWGVVNGSLTAARHLRATGGAIINVGSTLSDRAIPLQAMYSASKHAVKGFTDGLRAELERDQLPISVTLIKPGAINTPYPQHAKNYMAYEPSLPPPIYAPENVAEAILHCAEHPTRDLFVGGGGKATSAMGYYAPRLTDKLTETVFADAQQTNEGARRTHDNLYSPSPIALHERGEYDGHTMESSLYTKAAMHPLKAGALAVGAGVLVASLIRGIRGSGNSSEEANATAPEQDASDKPPARKSRASGKPRAGRAKKAAAPRADKSDSTSRRAANS